ncbi:MAG: hypothetical protein RLZ70_1544 [Verrucomicrobiota bacterium]
MVFHSIRWRILAWNFGLLAATATVLLVAFYQIERQNRLQTVDLQLREMIQLREMMSKHMGAVNDLIPGSSGPRSPLLTASGRPRSPDTPAQRQAKAEVSLNALVKERVWVFVADMAGSVQFQTPAAPGEPDLVERCREEVMDEAEAPTKGRKSWTRPKRRPRVVNPSTRSSLTLGSACWSIARRGR